MFCWPMAAKAPRTIEAMAMKVMICCQFQAGTPASTETPGSRAPAPRDDDALLEDLKTMFSAVEEGGERGDPGGR